MRKHINSGLSGDIYETPNYVIKTFQNSHNASVERWCLENIQVPRPKFYGQEGLEIYMEKINGITAFDYIVRYPNWALPLMGKIVKLQVQTHRHECNLTDLWDSTLRDLRTENLPKHIKDKVLKKFDLTVKDNKVCHNDFHFNNIMVQDHEPILIDWEKAQKGPPAADLAKTLMVIRFGKTKMSSNYVVENILRLQAFEIYRRLYILNSSEHIIDQLSLWWTILLAIRYSKTHESKILKYLESL